MYHIGDVTSVETTQTLLLKFQPTAIFHMASPTAAFNTQTETMFYRAVVCGTKNLLKCAQSAPSVQAFIYTSSMTVMAASAGSSFC